MGIYRFILAIFVAISHTGFVVFGLNPGVIAVISFFLISGYVMTALIHKNYFNRKKIVLFYLDRIFRIYPQYLFNIGVVLSVYFVFGLNSHYLSQPSLTGIIQNILLIPMGIFMCGSFLYENNNIGKNDLIKIILIFSIFLLILTFMTHHFLLPYNREALIGLIFGIPALSLLIKLDRSYLDDFFGNLSYGIFLSHYLFIFIFEELEIHWNFESTLLMLLFSMFLSIIGFYCFEKPVIKFRKKLRIKYSNPI